MAEQLIPLQTWIKLEWVPTSSTFFALNYDQHFDIEKGWINNKANAPNAPYPLGPQTPQMMNNDE